MCIINQAWYLGSRFKDLFKDKSVKQGIIRVYSFLIWFYFKLSNIILPITYAEMGQLNTYNPIYCNEHKKENKETQTAIDFNVIISTIVILGLIFDIFRHDDLIMV